MYTVLLKVILKVHLITGTATNSICTGTFPFFITYAHKLPLTQILSYKVTHIFWRILTKKLLKDFQFFSKIN